MALAQTMSFCIIVPLTLSQLKDQDPEERSPDLYVSEASLLSWELLSQTHVSPLLSLISACPDPLMRADCCRALTVTPGYKLQESGPLTVHGCVPAA